MRATSARSGRIRAAFCLLAALALLVATGQYLSHFHLQPVAAKAEAVEQAAPDGALTEHCSWCLQFDRLPAPPAALDIPAAGFHLVAVLEAERLERLALDPVHLWPPSRGPPALAC